MSSSVFMRRTAALLLVTFTSLTVEPTFAVIHRAPPPVMAGPQDSRGIKGREEQETRQAAKADLDVEAALVERHLIEKGLPSEIIARHHEAVAQWKTRQGELKSAMAAGPKGVEDFNRRYPNRKPAVKTDPKNLAWQKPKHKKVREPYERKEQFKSGLFREKPIHLAGPIPGGLTLPASSLPATPTAADLAATEDAQITQAIKDQAASLKNNPAKIYAWVRNNIAYVPTFGSIQGSHVTLKNRQGNAFDTASLLVALLRAANVPARFVYGTIEVPADKASNWVGGVRDGWAAQDLWSQGSVPTVVVTGGGVPKSVKLEHVWVEAWVDQVPSRGGVNKSGDAWLPLDASYKQYEFSKIDLAKGAPIDGNAIISQMQASATVGADGSVTGIDTSIVRQAFASYQPAAQAYIDSVKPGATFEDLVGTRKIIQANLSILPGTLPYKIVATGGKFADLPAVVRHTVTVNLYGTETDRALQSPSMSYTVSLPALAARPLGVTHAPATPADTATINSYKASGASSLPLYLIKVVPQLQIENATVASGAASTMGQAQYWDVTLTDPMGYSTATNNFNMNAGDEFVLGIDGAGITPALVQDRLDTVNSTSARENLHQTALHFWMEHDLYDETAARTRKVVRARLPSVGVFASPLTVRYYFGLPRTGYYASRAIDIKRNLQAATGDTPDLVRTYLEESGTNGSYLEGSIFNQLYQGTPGVGLSASRILATANALRIPIHTIDQNNIGAILPKLAVSSAVKDDISNAVAAGLIAVVPEKEITHLGVWSGTGYILRDPGTGEGAYLLDGGLNGGMQIGCLSKIDPLAGLFDRLLSAAINKILKTIASKLATSALLAAAGVAFPVATAVLGTVMFMMAFIEAVMAFTMAMLEYRMLAQQATSACQDKGAACPHNRGGATGKHLGGNPIHLGTGNKTQIETDYTGAGAFPLMVVRYYNSASGVEDLLGQGWTLSYRQRLDVQGSDVATPPGAVVAYRADGKYFQFANRSGSYTPDADVTERLVRLTDPAGNTSGWQYTDTNDNIETYDAAGKLLSIQNRAGLKHTLSYNGAGQLDRVSDDFGRTLSFGYHLDGKLKSITGPDGVYYEYNYDDNANLSNVSYPGSGLRVYHYEDGVFRHALTGITSENGKRYATWTYDGQGRAISSEHSGGANRIDVVYNPDGSATVTDARGTVRTYAFANILGDAKLTGISQPCATCGGSDVASIAYDPVTGFVTSTTDFNGVATTYRYNARGLEEERVEAAGTPEARTITTTWHPSFALPATITEPSAVAGQSKVTTYTYYPSGALQSITIQSGTLTRLWRYQANSYGLITEEDGPRTDIADITRYGYSGDNLSTITNALNQVIGFPSHDGHGRPLTRLDENSVTTAYTYHPRGWLTSETTSGETTEYRYYPAGQLERIVLPDTSLLRYEYDDAERLTLISDSLGNTIAYGLDKFGNPESTRVLDPTGALKETSSRVYDALNRLQRDIGAKPTEATVYDYWPDGSVKSMTDPLSHATGYQYDSLYRLNTLTDAKTGLTRYSYDAQDNLRSVTDPRNLATGYTYDGLNNLTQLASPDTGATVNTHDEAGNLKTSRDARLKTGTYVYDALNRVQSITYPDETVGFSYDAGSYGKGKRTGMTDAAGTTAWGYDALGRVTSKTQTAGGITLALGYAYTAGQLTQLTTPSGQSIGYGYLNNQITSITINGQPLLSGATYHPFGEVKGFAFANGQTYTRAFDLDGRIEAVTLGSDTRSFAFDDASRIRNLADSQSSQVFDYDELDRLTSATGTNGGANLNQVLGYDAVGNRLSLVQGAQSTTYTPAATSNRLATITTNGIAQSLTNDAAGNLTNNGSFGFVYSDRGRMRQVTSGAATIASYQVNGDGERIGKTVGSNTTRFVYDEDGHLLGEYTASGALIQETIWLDDTPVAMIKPNGAGVQVFYVFADHLDTPRVITNSAKQVVWRWDSDPFGTTPPNENPSGLGAFSYNLRFPGQYYDQETGLHYNYFRDYDPSTGRYVQSDPIGLDGGINTYAYVESDPLAFIDAPALARFKPGKYKKKTESCSVRKELYPTRVRSTTRTRLNQGFNGVCMECGKPIPAGQKTVQHKPQLVDTHNSLGYNTDQPTRNSAYNETAVGYACRSCQAEEGGKTRARYRTDTGPNFKPRPRR